LSALQSLSNLFTNDSLVQIILSCLNSTTTVHNKKVSFAWIPSHLGIKGNEKADVAANSSTKHSKVDNCHVRPLDVKQHIKTLIKSVWSDQWSSSTSKLRLIKPDVTSWFPPPVSMSRSQSVTLTRLRIGHTRLTHSHLLTKSDPPLCSTCNVPLSVDHLLTCKLYQNSKLNSSPLSLNNSKLDVTGVLHFIQNSGLVCEI
jgi:hypothetical protein